MNTDSKTSGVKDRHTLSILLVEDHAPTREEMVALIESQPDMTVVAEASTGEEGILRARENHPNVIVMDILLPGMNGIEATRKIHAEQPEVRILALSNHFGESLVKSIFDVGGIGYVRKNKAFEELIPALRKVATGVPYVGTGTAERRPSPES